MNYSYNKFKNSKKEKTEETKISKCICCENETKNGYFFCKNCYNDIKQIRIDFDHNRKEYQITNHYFQLKRNLENTNNNIDFNDNIKLFYALAEELDIMYENDYLIERIDKDINQAYKIHNQQKDKKKNIANKFNDEDFRNQWPRDYQCADGHYVRSLSEQNIDNWLYNNGYLHAYEKSVFMPSSPDDIVLCDFYLPKGNVYIEFWGIENDEKYKNRKQYKIKLYDENKLNRIDLTQQDIKRLDDIMPRLLAKYIKQGE